MEKKDINGQFISNLEFLQKVNDRMSELEKDFWKFQGDIRVEVSTAVGNLEKKIDSLIAKISQEKHDSMTQIAGKRFSLTTIWAALAAFAAVVSAVGVIIQFI